MGTTTAATERLSAKERERLQFIDAELRDNLPRLLKTGVYIGHMLREVAKARLYREYGSFAAYCQTFEGFSESKARHLMAWAKMSQKMIRSERNGGGTLPPVTSEAQARALASLPEPLQAPVWEQAIRPGAAPPTGAEIARLGAKAFGSLSPKQQEDILRVEEKAVIVDEAIREARDGIERIQQQLASKFKGIRRGLRRLAEVSDLSFARASAKVRKAELRKDKAVAAAITALTMGEEYVQQCQRRAS